MCCEVMKYLKHHGTFSIGNWRGGAENRELRKTRVRDRKERQREERRVSESGVTREESSNRLGTMTMF